MYVLIELGNTIGMTITTLAETNNLDHKQHRTPIVRCRCIIYRKKNRVTANYLYLKLTNNSEFNQNCTDVLCSHCKNNSA